MPFISLGDLRDLAGRVLKASKTSHENAALVAGALVRADADGITGSKPLYFFLERYALAYRAELDCFLEMLDGVTMQAPNGMDGLAALVLAEAAVESLAAGREVELDSSNC